MESKYKFSVVVPVYNGEDYLAEALDSVVNQSIGFEDNIQLILVNDGSKDASGDICKKYRDNYPDNIVYVEKENGGVSSARNEAFEYIEGRYIAYLDTDDKWDVNAFSIAYDYFEKHYDEVDIIACRVKRFEARNDYHVLDYKFKAGTRIADINDPKEYFSIQTLITSTVIKSEAIKDLRFDTRIICGEDTIFCNLIMLEKCKIGYLKEALYYYRQRSAKDSTVDKIKRNSFYYDEMLEYYHNGMINYSKQKFGRVLPYLQAIMTNDLMWHFEACETHEMLTDKEFAVYKKRIKDILSYIDDDIIFGHPLHKAYTRRSAAVNFKYGIDYYKSLTLKDNRLYFRKYSVFNMACRNTLCMLNSLGAVNNKIRVEVLVASWTLKATETGGRFVFRVGERFVKPKEILEYAPKTAKTLDGGEYYFTSLIFNLKLKLKEGETLKLEPYIIYGDEPAPICINCTKASQGVNPFTTCLVQGKYAVSYADDAIKISRK